MHLIKFKIALTEKIALWRESYLLLSKLATQLHRFHMPEVQDSLTQILFEDTDRGN